MKRLFVILFVFCTIFDAKATDKYNNDFKIGFESYISYENEIEDAEVVKDQFNIHRSYFNFKKGVTDYMRFRVTLDSYSDDDGWETRIKYIFGEFILPDIAMLDKLRFKVGIIHTPWLDFQTDYYKYRMQGKLFMDEVKIFDSADFGATLSGDVKVGDDKKLASFHFGAYNGSGYKRVDISSHNVFQARATLYPIFPVNENFQISYLFINGKSNPFDETIEPDWQTHSFYSAYKNDFFTVSGEYVFGHGNQNGTLIDESGKSIDYTGFSVFGEIKPFKKWSVIARYDNLEPEMELHYTDINRFIAGVAYYLDANNVVLLDYQREFDEDFGIAQDEILKMTLKIKFEDVLQIK